MHTYAIVNDSPFKMHDNIEDIIDWGSDPLDIIMSMESVGHKESLYNQATVDILNAWHDPPFN